MNITLHALRASILLAVTSVLVFTCAPSAQAVPSNPPVVVSLTFDDGYAEQVEAAKLLAANGLRGTFFTPSGFVGTDGYMNVDDLRYLVRQGHEIGGHTVTHPDLTRVTSEEAIRQICDDRANLTHWGFAVTSFAYPYAGTDRKAEDAASACGYNSARGLDGVRTKFSCQDCDYAETIPPSDAFLTAAPQDVHSSWTLQDLKDTVINAKSSGGWVQEAFHHLSDSSSDPLNFSPLLFREFVDWLVAEQTTGAIAVKTVHEVIGGTNKPLVASTPAPTPPPGANMLENPGFEDAGEAWPRCWQLDTFGSSTATLTPSTSSHSGGTAVTLTVTNFGSGDSKVMTSMDLGGCSPPTSPGHKYALGAWYRSDHPVQFKVFYRSGLGFWQYWTESPQFPPTTDFGHAAWTTPVLPEGASSVSVGLALTSAGTLTSDDYELYDGGLPIPPDPQGTAFLGDLRYDGMGWLAGIALLGVLTRGYYLILRTKAATWLNLRTRGRAKTRNLRRSDYSWAGRRIEG